MSGWWLRFAGLRSWLLLLVLLAVVPALGLTVFTHVEQRRNARARVFEDALRLVRLASADHERLIEGARHLLATLARVPAIRGAGAPACHELLADLLARFPSYANLGVADRSGEVVCSGLRLSPTSIADRSYFRRALESRDFAVGEYQIGRLTRRPTVNFGFPVLDEQGRMTGVVFSALDLAWLSQLAARAELPAGAMLTLIDRQGRVLTRFPDHAAWMGKPIPEAPAGAAALAAAGRGSLEATGADGRPHLFAFAPLGRAGDAYVIVGIPLAVAFAEADRQLARSLLTLGLVAALALVAAWLVGDVAITRRVRDLVGTTKRLTAGDLGARTTRGRGRGELDELARAFDQMAEALARAEERKRLEEELRRRTFELEQQNRVIQEANRLKSEFVSMVSHELRTPLTSIQGFVDHLLEAEGSLTGRQRECLGIVRSNVGRLLGLIEELLEAARIEAGRIELRRARLDLAPIVQDVVAMLRPLIDAKQQHLELALADALPPVWADHDRVAQILTNLIANAQKYTPAGGRIMVVASPEDGFVQVGVRDTGVGLTAEEQANLFTRFFRAPGAQAVAGTGLGLVITRALVELHGGTLSVSSTPGRGATFVFTLPTCAERPRAA